MADTSYDLVCFSHARWDDVGNRSQRLLASAARERRVFFIEDTVYDSGQPHLAMRRLAEGIVVVVPTLPPTTPIDEVQPVLRTLIDHLLDHYEIASYVLWFSTPSALPFARHLQPASVVYDCPDEHAGLRCATPGQLELRMLGAADLVLTASDEQRDLFSDHHANVHGFDHVDVACTWAAMTDLLDDAIEARAAAYDELPTPRRATFGSQAHASV